MDKKQFNYNHLHYFFETSKLSSIKKVSESLDVASSTVSHQIKCLEKSLGTRLFHRVGKELVLTADGQKLFEKCKPMFDQANRIREDFFGHDASNYQLKIGIQETFSTNQSVRIASSYAKLMRGHGTVETQRLNSIDSLHEALRQGNIDWAIGNRPSRYKSIASKLLAEEEIGFYCSPGLLKKYECKYGLLKDSPIYLCNWDPVTNETVLESLRSQGIVPTEIIYYDHVNFAKEMCSAGTGYMYAIDFLSVNSDSPLEKIDIVLDEKSKTYALWRKKDDDLAYIEKLKSLFEPTGELLACGQQWNEKLY